MDPRRLRIFVTTSHISTVYITLLARQTYREGDEDILLVDSGTRRDEKILQVRLTAEFHRWSLFHNFSKPAASIHDLDPGFVKRLTRRVKTLPLIRGIYNAMLAQYVVKTDAAYREKIRQVMTPHPSGDAQVELYVMTGTYLNRPLGQLYPSASTFYVEHGIGDYYYALENGKPIGEMYAVFAQPFKTYLGQLGLPVNWVHELPGLETFPQLAVQLMERQAFRLDTPVREGKKNIFILLEAVDMYEVPETFWAAYLDHVFAQLDNPEQYHFVLKPHHLQSEVSLRHTREHLARKNYSYTLLQDERIKSAAIEVLFSHWAGSVSQVFFLFSSAGFYLSVLYPLPGIRYRYSTEFMAKYTGNAPLQFRTLFNDIRPLIDNVFAKRCEPF